MIKTVEIHNYKSITELSLELGRVNVLIGANGSGKSNILEAIALGSAAANDKLDNEFLAARGIRVSDDPRFMRSAFDKQMVDQDIVVAFSEGDNTYSYTLQKDNENPYSPWRNKDEIAAIRMRTVLSSNNQDQFREEIEREARLVLGDIPAIKERGPKFVEELIRLRVDSYLLHVYKGPDILRRFLVFSPENSALRIFEDEGQIQPLGIRGEGLFKCLRVMNRQNKAGIDEIKERLHCIGWYSDFELDHDLAPAEKRLSIHDRYLDRDLACFDQKSANEGFLFMLFYLCLFVSSDTPQFFAIDNIDASLNPKLCAQLMMDLSNIAVSNQKQVVLTTHNPAVLDGLNLTDDEQRLFVISRNRRGHTRAKRISAPQSTAGATPVRLSEAFLRGYLGGLPDNF